MNELHFPLHFRFKLLTPSGDFLVHDAQGNTIAYTRQKIFALKDKIEVFNDDSRSQLRYRIDADRILDFNAVYRISDAQGNTLGSLRRKGMRSLWRVHYQIHDAQGQHIYDIREHNPWTAVANALFGEIPILGAFSGYLFHPRYHINTPDGQPGYLLKKQPALFEGRFSLSKTGNSSPHDETVVLAAMAAILNERSAG